MKKNKLSDGFITKEELDAGKKAAKAEASEVKEVKEVKKAPKKDKKPGFFKRLGTRFKDTNSELKKVSWPGFPKVVKQTGVVLLVVVCFLIVIGAFDFGLVNLLKLLY